MRDTVPPYLAPGARSDRRPAGLRGPPAMMGLVNRRTVPLVAAIWVVTVALASLAIWWTISSAGMRVGRQSSTDFTQPSPAPTGAGDASTSNWTGLGGRISAQCRGADVVLRSAVPADGFSVEVIEQASTRAIVEFERSEHDAGYRIEISCGPAGVSFREQ